MPQAIGAGAAVGFLTGLFGVGGGFLILPALALLLGLPMTAAVGTSLVIIVLNSAGGFVAYLGDIDVDYAIVGAFAATAIIGSLIAGRFARRVPDGRLRRWFGYLVFLVAALVISQLAINPGPSLPGERMVPTTRNAPSIAAPHPAEREAWPERRDVRTDHVTWVGRRPLPRGRTVWAGGFSTARRWHRPVKTAAKTGSSTASTRSPLRAGALAPDGSSRASRVASP